MQEPMTNLKLLLTLAKNAKPIPYAAARHSDGTRNFGFTSLKGQLDQIGHIEEAKGVVSFQNLLRDLNQPASPFFSVGCEKASSADKTGHWRSGFIEFAFNSPQLVGDAGNYFSLFYHFSYAAEAFVEAHDVQFHWIVQPARFTQGACDGFTCSVWFTTSQFRTAAEAVTEWDSAVDCFSAFIRTVDSYEGETMYAAVA